MGTAKQIDIKNRTYYFYNDMIDIRNFDVRLLKIDKNDIKTLVFTILDILKLKKMMIKNPLHLLINHANGHIEEKG